MESNTALVAGRVSTCAVAKSLMVSTCHVAVSMSWKGCSSTASHARIAGWLMYWLDRRASPCATICVFWFGIGVWEGGALMGRGPG